MKLLILSPCIRFPIPDFCVLEDDGQIFFRGAYLPEIPKKDETQIVLDAASVPPSQLSADSSVAAICEGEGGVLSFWGWNPSECVWVELANPLPPIPDKAPGLEPQTAETDTTKPEEAKDAFILAETASTEPVPQENAPDSEQIELLPNPE